MLVQCYACGKQLKRRTRPHKQLYNACKECCIEARRKWSQDNYQLSFSHGYLRVRDEEGNWIEEHRQVVEQWIGRKLLSTELVHHKDEDRVNNDPSNLSIVSRPEHMRMHNLGALNSQAKLSEKQVIEILEAAASGRPKTVLAQQYNVHVGEIFRVISGKRWHDVVVKWKATHGRSGS